MGWIQAVKRFVGGLMVLGLAWGGAGVVGAAPADPELIQRGEYLARVGDCVACHTAPGGPVFAGGLELPTPVGNIVATNITPSKTAGIGNYTLEQFDAAVRRGRSEERRVGKEGSRRRAPARCRR